MKLVGCSTQVISWLPSSGYLNVNAALYKIISEPCPIPSVPADCFKEYLNLSLSTCRRVYNGCEGSTLRWLGGRACEIRRKEREEEGFSEMCGYSPETLTIIVANCIVCLIMPDCGSPRQPFSLRGPPIVIVHTFC